MLYLCDNQTSQSVNQSNQSRQPSRLTPFFCRAPQMRLPEVNTAPSPPWSTVSSVRLPVMTEESTSRAVETTQAAHELVGGEPRAHGSSIVPSSIALVRSLLPSTKYLTRYPLHVVYTKSIMNNNRHAPPPSDYLLVQPSQDGGKNTSLPPGKRWLRETPRQFYKADAAPIPEGDEAAVLTIEPVAHISVTPGYTSVARHIYRRYGWIGFFRGLATAHCSELLHHHFSARLRSGFDSGYKRLWGRLESEAWEDEVDLKTRFRTWFLTDEGRSAVVKILASTTSAALTYPLKVIMLRQIIYEPLDNQPLGFVDMAKLTIIYDGPKSLIRGIVPYTALKLAAGIVGVLARAAVSAARWDEGDEKLGPYVSQQSKAIADIVCQPVLHKIQYSQVVSLIPGLPSGEGPRLAQYYKAGGPGMFLMLASNVALLGMRVVASTHFHFLLPHDDEYD
eukprot:Protomagalhaensia_sp_Gyna_25__5863@NODE_87_length_5382_cov_39_295901_g67_i0_p2_GENE_NODE_87_length_5382_cov_39_295901_g67_i0NODE_87_length_5382_cov_39_295901_g67_i0_p2_ORF_typecomplete_len449_score43_21Mito_carr/PF00153_27/0_025Mito_carr/PF00153_27/0_00023_NODE_87_length_5382_cov_39_295901_g67_i031564502